MSQELTNFREPLAALAADRDNSLHASRNDRVKSRAASAMHLVGLCQLGELRVRLAGIVGTSAQQAMIAVNLSERSAWVGWDTSMVTCGGTDGKCILSSELTRLDDTPVPAS